MHSVADTGEKEGFATRWGGDGQLRKCWLSPYIDGRDIYVSNRLLIAVAADMRADFESESRV